MLFQILQHTLLQGLLTIIHWSVALQLTFDLDVKANAFEMNIRLLGGLLSSHLLAEDAKLGLMPGGYEGGLLDLALDLGTRLLPAFTTSPTGGGTLS